MRRFWCVIAAVAWCACGGSNATGDGGPPRDGSVDGSEDASAHGGGARDAGRADAPHDGGTDDASLAGEPPEIPARGPLLVTNAGGPVMTRAELVTVDWADYPFDAELRRLGDFLPTSRWLAATSEGYGVSLVGHTHYTLAGPPPTTGLEVAPLARVIAENVASGRWPAHPGDATAQPLWLFLVPPAAGERFGGLHGFVMGETEGHVIATVGYRVGPYASVLADIESVIAHEVIEALTDPVVDGTTAWRARGVLATLAAFNGTSTEVADLCEGTGNVVESGFTLCRSWSNAAASAGAPPCQPVPPGASFGVEGPSGDVLASPGASFDVPFVIVGDDASVEVELALAAFDASVGGVAGGPLHARLDRSRGHVGDTVHMSVVVPTNSADLSSLWYFRIDTLVAGRLVSVWPVHVVPR